MQQHDSYSSHLHHQDHQAHHDHSHGQKHSHDHNGHHHDQHNHHHDHQHASGVLGWVREIVPFFHGHSHGEAHVDAALETDQRGMWALKISLLGLGLTALFQVIIYLLSGSVGLLADTIHNFSDALTAIPLWIAFVLARRAATRRYTYGYGRAEDLAGVAIIVMIFLSALLSGYESIQKFIHPVPLQNAWWVVLAAFVGFLGNEAVAMFRIRVGREIGSAALVADGQHARIDGLTSLAVIFGALGSILGFPLADPIIGFLITVAILFIVKDTVVVMWHRLMDAVDPALVARIEQAAQNVEGVEQVHSPRVRWMGHKLHVELSIVVDEDLSTRESHAIVEEVRHALFHAQPHLARVSIHVDPCGHSAVDYHSVTAHHEVRLV